MAVETNLTEAVRVLRVNVSNTGVSDETKEYLNDCFDRIVESVESDSVEGAYVTAWVCATGFELDYDVTTEGTHENLVWKQLRTLADTLNENK